MDLSTVFGVSTRIPCLHSSPRARSNITENVAIEGRNLSFSFATRQGKFFPILKDCSLRVPSGQLWMLLGPNGCGKSTLLKVVMPTVEADVAFGLGKFILTEDEVRQRVSKALDDVGMSTYMQRPVQTLSGGQKQRVAIAGALAEACKVLLLDELTTFLDQNDQIGVIKAVKNSLVASDEITALWVTHRLEELKYADGAFYMENGRVVKVGDGSSIMDFINARQASYFNQTNS
ncbi:ABC transporter I family member 10 isoform X3 [Hevea brasiliensis]|uniref:ABC transporter I family member 10 isoform X3 n=1 Tax=Hevea brasiliensis TaxID=3981 RepID=UPI0025E9ECCB|nr:ABC transporter I family member 10 isoform X3 [Hevea brasiliensis]